MLKNISFGIYFEKITFKENVIITFLTILKDTIFFFLEINDPSVIFKAIFYFRKLVNDIF